MKYKKSLEKVLEALLSQDENTKKYLNIFRMCVDSWL